MSIKCLAAVMGLLLDGIATCDAEQPVRNGTIQFHGSIVEPSCNVSGSRSVMELKKCPLVSRGTLFQVRSVQPTSTVQALGHSLNVKLVADSTSGRYYDQSYVLIDNRGNPVLSGSYIITLTSP